MLPAQSAYHKKRMCLLLTNTVDIQRRMHRLLNADMPVPKLICVGWYSLDVLFTSSTICHLCMISVDRYLSLTYPLRYGHAKKKKHTIMKIALVWVVSFCIAGPLFVLSMWDEHLDAIVVSELSWVEQGLTSHSTHNRSFRGRIFPGNQLHWYW